MKAARRLDEGLWMSYTLRYYGDHYLRAEIDGQQVSGPVGRRDLILDERVNRWHTAKSDLGTVRLDAAGERTLVLTMDRADGQAELGATVCGVRLSPEPG
jgi:hypothetical protein